LNYHHELRTAVSTLDTYINKTKILALIEQKYSRAVSGIPDYNLEGSL
jgi:hypothetical protein